MTLARASLLCLVVRMYLERHSLIGRLKLQVGLCPATNIALATQARPATAAITKGVLTPAICLSLRPEMHAPIRHPKTAAMPNA
jgi:hypothetical protein